MSQASDHYNCVVCGNTADMLLKDGIPNEDSTSQTGAGEYHKVGMCCDCQEEVTCALCGSEFQSKDKNFTVLDEHGTQPKVVGSCCFHKVEMCLSCEEVYLKTEMVKVSDGGDEFDVCEDCAEDYED